MSSGCDKCDVHSYLISVAVFNTFNYTDAVGADDNKRRQNATKVETTRTRWFDGRARVGYSKDGIPIVYHIPGAISKPVHVSLSLQFLFSLSHIRNARITHSKHS